MIRKRVLGATAAVSAGLALMLAAVPASADPGGVPGNCIGKQAANNATVISSAAPTKIDTYSNPNASDVAVVASYSSCGPR